VRSCVQAVLSVYACVRVCAAAQHQQVHAHAFVRVCACLSMRDSVCVFVCVGCGMFVFVCV